MSSETPRMTELLQSYKLLRDELVSNTKSSEECTDLIQRMNALSSEIACESNPHLKDRTCPLCDKKFNGWGNSPAPLEIDGQVCDTCNTLVVIPVRFGNKKVAKFAMKKYSKNKK
jgi:hypothetical protein